MFTKVFLVVVPAIVAIEQSTFASTSKVNDSVTGVSNVEPTGVALSNESEVAVGVVGNVDVVGSVEGVQVLAVPKFVGNPKFVSVFSSVRNNVKFDRTKLSQDCFEVKVKQDNGVKAVK